MLIATAFKTLADLTSRGVFIFFFDLLPNIYDGNRIRTLYRDEFSCPLTALASHLTSRTFKIDEYVLAACAVGISKEDAGKIIVAADDREIDVPYSILRPSLLLAVKLEEPFSAV